MCFRRKVRQIARAVARTELLRVVTGMLSFFRCRSNIDQYWNDKVEQYLASAGCEIWSRKCLTRYWKVPARIRQVPACPWVKRAACWLLTSQHIELRAGFISASPRLALDPGWWKLDTLAMECWFLCRRKRFLACRRRRKIMLICDAQRSGKRSTSLSAQRPQYLQAKIFVVELCISRPPEPNPALESFHGCIQNEEAFAF